jgi:thiamine biosynthesis lipoprotein
MGTGYMIRVAAWPPGLDTDALQARVEGELAAVNAAMSTYDPEAEISRFNRYRGDDWFPVSPALAATVAAAARISAQTGGAFDVTIGPLVDAWGFGATGARPAPPAAAELRAARAAVGMDGVTVRLEPPALRKARPSVHLDLSAIAKGHAVDRLAGVLQAAGVTGYLVEIGGELRTAGRRHDGEPWRVGIEQPVAGGRRVQRALPMLRDGAVATSGDYRNFFEVDGQRYAHIIDPRTGMPVPDGLASVTVIARECLLADAWATGLSVLGAADGYALAAELGLAALFIERQGDELAERMTPAFASWLAAGEAGNREVAADD